MHKAAMEFDGRLDEQGRVRLEKLANDERSMAQQILELTAETTGQHTDALALALHGAADQTQRVVAVQLRIPVEAGDPERSRENPERRMKYEEPEHAVDRRRNRVRPASPQATSQRLQPCSPRANLPAGA